MKQLETLDREQVYRYLGYHADSHTLTEQLEELVESAVQEVLEQARPRAVFSPMMELETQENGLAAACLSLPGRDIARHLEHCTHAVLLAVTLGAQLDALIRRTEALDMARAVVLDATANVAVEQAAQNAEDELRSRLAQEHLYLTGRYSPGYGDFPISSQKELLRITDAARKIGLSVTASHIMIPRKSVTAVLGVAEIPVKGHLAGCGNCVLRKTCIYRKRGTTCAI